MLHENFYEDSQNLFVNAVAPRSFFTPFNNAADALKGSSQSSQIISLNGQWNLQVYADISNINKEVLTQDYSSITPKHITVPGFLTDERFAPHYGTEYPFALDLPHVFGINPAAVYFRDFEISNDFVSHKKYLTFEGVGCAYIYINGEFAGFTKHRRTFCEFDISDFCRLGTNRVTIVVLKWSDANYHQCQNIINLYGIFGDVNVLCRPRGHLTDVAISSALSEDLSGATIEVNIEALIADEATLGLYSPSGEFLSSSGVDSTGFSRFNIAMPMLWSAETPDLYTLLVEYNGEFISFKVGIRTVKNDDGVFKINRRPVKLKGINWQLINAKSGYALSTIDMQATLLKLKRCNLNAIKFAEMPPFALLQLCDELGFYVICGNGLDMTFMRHCTNPAELHVLNDVISGVALRTFESCKTFTSVIIWDLGKNLGFGEVLTQMRDEMCKKDDTRLLFYEDIEDDSIGDFKRIFDNQISLYEKNARSAILPNCNDNIAQAYKELYYDDHNCGVFYDSLYSQAINFNSKIFTKADLLANNAHNTQIHENPLLNANGDSMPGFYELKFLAAPLIIEPVNLYEGIFKVTSRYDFIYLSRLQGSFELTCGAEVLQKESIDVLSTPPKRSQQINLNLNLPADEDAYIRLTFTQQSDDIHAPEGYVLAEYQFKIPKTTGKIKNLPAWSYPPQITENAHKLNISGNNFTYIFNKKTGCFETLAINGENILQSPVIIDLAASLEKIASDAYNDNAKIANIFTRIYDLYYDIVDCCAVLSLKISLNAAGIPPIAEVDAVYKISSNGLIDMDFNAVFADDIPPVSGFGLSVNLPPGFSDVTYFGLGPNNCTAKRHAAMYKAVFTQGLKLGYGQNSAKIYRHNCDWAAVKSDDCGILLCGNFDFAADISNQKNTVYAGTVSGSAAENAEKSLHFEIKLQPLFNSGVNFEEIVNEIE